MRVIGSKGSRAAPGGRRATLAASFAGRELRRLHLGATHREWAGDVDLLALEGVRPSLRLN
jgi:hypothetical protein